jgi:hypothetical protein
MPYTPHSCQQQETALILPAEMPLRSLLTTQNGRALRHQRTFWGFLERWGTHPWSLLHVGALYYLRIELHKAICNKQHLAFTAIDVRVTQYQHILQLQHLEGVTCDLPLLYALTLDNAGKYYNLSDSEVRKLVPFFDQPALFVDTFVSPVFKEFTFARSHFITSIRDK